MKRLTKSDRIRLAVLWAAEAAVIVYNVRTPSFGTMVAPLPALAGFVALLFSLLGRILPLGGCA